LAFQLWRLDLEFQTSGDAEFAIIPKKRRSAVSRAVLLFEEIKAGGTQFLRNLVTTKRKESDYLEFKGAGKLKDEQAKEGWSQALSGFANIEGGVLVWGIRAARNKATGNDEAESLDLVADVARFAQMLRDVELEAVIDPVPGVQIEVYSDTDASGFVVCLIPEGPHKPYRAELHNKQYYQRIGDKFAPISHSLLRSLFYPPALEPKFRLTIRQSATRTIESSGAGPTLAGNRFELTIQNTGRVSARDVWVMLKVGDPLQFRGKTGQRQGEEGYALSRPLHPSELFQCATSWVEYSATRTLPKEITYEVSIYATDCEAVNARLVFADLTIDDAKTTDFFPSAPRTN
jgi:hypothetical protein